MAESDLPVTWSKVAGPEGFVINPTTGAVAWTPTMAGAYDITIRATNEVAYDEQTFVVEVFAGHGQPPNIHSTFNEKAVVGARYFLDFGSSIPYSADDPYKPDASGDPPLVWSKLDGPDGMAVDSTTGLTTWTPTAAGTVPVSLRVENASGYHQINWVVRVAPVNSAPTATANGPYTGFVGAFVYFSSSGTMDAEDGGNLAWRMWDFGDGMRGVGGHPYKKYAVPGTYPVTLTVLDSAGAQAFAATTVTISPTPDPPTIISSFNPSALVGVPYLYDVDGKAAAVGDAPISWSKVSGPAEFSIDSASGLVQWTPIVPGVQAITIRATNDVGYDDQSLSVAVAPAPVAPTIVSSGAVAGQVGVPYQYDEDARAEATGDEPIGWSAVGAPAGFTIDAETGLITWTPTTAGPQGVTIRATNAVGYNDESFVVDVAPGALSPAIVSTP
ncbi:MAG: PKD domain-containing protein, partial [Candidatus Methylomirabilis sp.]|nr:PKD domain-containing protein [Deltaproteobacteria bacterium]